MPVIALLYTAPFMPEAKRFRSYRNADPESAELSQLKLELNRVHALCIEEFENGSGRPSESGLQG